MTESTYFEQTDHELEELNRKRDDFMADATPVCLADTPKLIELGEKLRTEDTSINAYELYKHPEARAKLFAQIVEACFLLIAYSSPVPVQPTQAQRIHFCEYLEGQFQNIIKKLIVSTDKQAMEYLLEALQLPKEKQAQFVRDVVVSGLLSEK
ncbi:hypothetical protein [Streptococcus sp. DD04]|uniref:hypothetical protein n=1 Tax=Streptococcus sp. DD04 TaxID=1776578 RepID=UPI00078544C4|nr:hypothetical protein [Streptococcus sp. DD04]KXT66830.1 hypothetical protein STRDD04_00403 [Streptococcus sp. DD04]